MKNLPWIISLVLALFLVVGWGKIQTKPQKWEHKSFIADVSPVTNEISWREDGKAIQAPTSVPAKVKELGEAGWELVTIEFTESIYSYWFKRPKG